jgi:hypothetical protein
MLLLRVAHADPPHVARLVDRLRSACGQNLAYRGRLGIIFGGCDQDGSALSQRILIHK